MRRTLVRAAFAAVAPALALAPMFRASAQSPADVPLRVIRVTPSGDALPTTTISVTFDRPVAGSLDRTVDPATILSVTPAVAGKPE